MRSDKSRSNTSSSRRCGFCVARFVLPEAALRRFPHLFWNALAASAAFSSGFARFPIHSAAPPDAPRTEASGNRATASVGFKPSYVEFVGSAELS